MIYRVTGKLNLSESGVKFGENSEGNFYLIFNGNEIYFHNKQRRSEQYSTPKRIIINKENLRKVFSLGRNLYNLFASHKIHSINYKSSKDLYI